MKNVGKKLAVIALFILMAACENQKEGKKEICLCNVACFKFQGPKKGSSEYAKYNELNVVSRGGAFNYLIFYNSDGNNIFDRAKGEEIVRGFVGDHGRDTYGDHEKDSSNSVVIWEGTKIAIAVSFTETNFQITWFEEQGESCGIWAGTLDYRTAVAACDEAGCYDENGESVSEEEINYPDAVTE